MGIYPYLSASSEDERGWPVVPPNGVLGIIGGGQLGRMLALAAARLGVDCAILTPDSGAPATKVAAKYWIAAYDDDKALSEFARACSVITFEFENIPVSTLERLRDFGVRVAPNSSALSVTQDRLCEKLYCQKLGFECAPFVEIQRSEDIVAGLKKLGIPAILKTRRQGYDGHGQSMITKDNAKDAAVYFAKIGSVPAILEGYVAFERELSVIGARGGNGELALYPLVENHHEGGVLRRSLAPANVDAKTTRLAFDMAKTILENLNYIGVMAIELFLLPDGRLLINELAPRVHNSGHWTLDACSVDQFEQHVRAVLGWPLGPIEILAKAEMINLLGHAVDDWVSLIADPGARLWLYGKAEAVRGRKMGHVTRLDPVFK